MVTYQLLISFCVTDPRVPASPRPRVPCPRVPSPKSQLPTPSPQVPTPSPQIPVSLLVTGEFTDVIQGCKMLTSAHLACAIFFFRQRSLLVQVCLQDILSRTTLTHWALTKSQIIPAKAFGRAVLTRTGTVLIETLPVFIFVECNRSISI